MGQMQRNHLVNLLLPVALLLVFAVSALAVLLFATDIYKDTVRNSSRNDSARIVLSYVGEKIHRYDSADSVYLDEVEGCKTLVMAREYDGHRYFTYIYLLDNSLRELFIREGAAANLSSGRKIADMEQFEMSQPAEDVFSFTCTDEKGQSASATVAVRAG